MYEWDTILFLTKSEIIMNTSTDTSETICAYQYQFWSAIDTPGRLIPSLTQGRTTNARWSPIQVITYLIIAYK